MYVYIHFSIAIIINIIAQVLYVWYAQVTQIKGNSDTYLLAFTDNV